MSLFEFIDHMMKNVYTIAAFYSILAVFFLNTAAGKRFIELFRTKILYSDPSQNKSDRLILRVRRMESAILDIQKAISSTTIKDKFETIDSEINKHLADKLPTLIAERLKQSKDIEDGLRLELVDMITLEVKNYLGSTDVAKIIEAHDKLEHTESRLQKHKDLETQINNELNSAGRMKTVMINLFIFFNFGVILLYLFGGSQLSDHAIYAITGSYISLASFIIYIYRTSNFRTSVLLAIREDNKKFFDAIEYIGKHKKGTNLTNADVDLVKLLLTNRSEREKMSDHPYEVVLKGVANSNIQFRGGKMALKEEKKRNS